MCEYCGATVNNKNLYNGEYESELLEIAYDKLSYFQFDGTVFTVDINYCPMCGEPLSEEAKAIRIAIERINDGSESKPFSALAEELYSPESKSLYGRIEDEVNSGGGGL